MKMQMLKVGEPDKATGQREYVFQVMVNRMEPTMYQVTARHEADAQEKLRDYVQADAAQLQSLGAAGGAGTVLLIVGGVAAAFYALRQHIAAKSAAAPAPRPQVKRPAAVVNGFEVSGDIDVEDDGSNAVGVGAPFARSAARSSTVNTTASERSPAERVAAAERAAAAERMAAAERVGAARAARPNQTSMAPMVVRPILYNGVKGNLFGADPQRSIRIVVFSDVAIEPLLSLVRSSSYDEATGTIRDGIVVMSFPADAAGAMRSQDALEVMIGGPAPRRVDVQEPTAEAALGAVRTALGSYLG